MKTWFAGACLVAAALPTVAVPVVVNISGQNATCCGSWSPLGVEFDAGTYTATPIRPPTPGALHTAFNYGMGLGWSARYAIGLDPLHYVAFGASGPAPGAGWDSADEAFAHTTSGSFTVPSRQTVYFGVGDSYYGDNVGGVSLLISAVPEPAAALLMLAGLGLLGSRRRSTGAT